jgi:hypothetical protein
MKNSIKTAIILAILWVVGLLVLVSNAGAISTDVSPTITPIWVDNPLANSNQSNGNYTVYSIEQGDDVYLGDHIDISRALGGNPDIAYFGGWEPDATKAPIVIELPNAHTDWYDYYIDPAVFGKYPGVWYKWNGYYEPNGNTKAFRVISNYRNYTLTFPNGTVENKTELVKVEHTLEDNEIPNKEILPTKHVSDYVIPRGGSINISVNRTSAIWIFDGSDNSIVYSKSVWVKNTTRLEIFLNDSTIKQLPPNDYKIIIQSVGDVSPYFDVVYNGNNTMKWFDRSTFEVHTVDFNGMTPDVAVSTMEHIFKNTFDKYEIKHLEIQEPTVTIDRMDKVGLVGAKEFYRTDDMRGNVSLMDVRGYTNALAGTKISVILDIDKTTPNTVKYNTVNTVTQGTSFGDMRYYQVYVPLYEDSLDIGMHMLTAKTEIGGSMNADFPISVMPADSFQPNATVKWVGDENPWKPNMTIPAPVVQVVTVVQTQVVVQKVTPSPEEVKVAQEEVVSEKIRTYVGYIVGALVIILIGYIVFRFLYRAWKRKQWEEE